MLASSVQTHPKRIFGIEKVVLEGKFVAVSAYIKKKIRKLSVSHNWLLYRDEETAECSA